MLFKIIKIGKEGIPVSAVWIIQPIIIATGKTKKDPN